VCAQQGFEDWPPSRPHTNRRRRIPAMGDKSPKKEAAKAPKKSIKERRRDKQAKKAGKGTASL
jgi:hypothetical protein